ncbi:MAG: 50S ribosomal protein L29 [Bryobacterales bacterium]|jgi:large subunit ribosomal protein L29|nr:50S ribosomal protein L29 [Bryobacterales bacterium]
MKAEKYREMERAELEHEVGEIREQLFRLRFQMSMGQTDGLKKARVLKKDLARVYTVMREKELAAKS